MIFLLGHSTLIFIYQMPLLQGVSSSNVRWMYSGESINNERHGFGVCHWENGDRYEGSWANNKTHGYGIYVQGDGARYDGQFFEHRMHGFGVCVFLDGDRQEGEWRDGVFFRECPIIPSVLEIAYQSACRARSMLETMSSS